jgi:RHS repeat-associated protein
MEWQASLGSTPGFTKEHIYAGQRRIAEVHTITGQAAKVTHAHPDPSGSPAMLSDASGLVAAREHYRPYGDKLFSPNTNESAGFANKAFDASTNLSYMSARYYNPTLGRFISPDPVHFVENNVHSFNRYAYANNNPMRYIDPTGLEGEAISESDKTEKTEVTAMPQEQQVAMLGAIARGAAAVGRALGIGVTKEGAKQASKEGAKKAAAEAKTLSDQERKAIESLQKQIDKHQQKLEDFKTAPTVRPGMENMPKEMIEQQQKARMEHLTKEMQTFRDNISKIQNGATK